MNHNHPFVEQAIEQARQSLAKMTPDERRALVAKHANGPLALSLMEAAEFLESFDPSEP